MWSRSKGNHQLRVWPWRQRSRRAGALQTLQDPRPRSDLDRLSLMDLTIELVARLSVGDAYDGTRISSSRASSRTARRAADVHLNRFAPSRFRDIVGPILDRLPPSELQGATVVDLGSDSLNPFVFGFVLLMLGAERAYSVDSRAGPDPNGPCARSRTAAGWLLVDAHASPAATRWRRRDARESPRLRPGEARGGNRTSLAPRHLPPGVDLATASGLADGEVDSWWPPSHCWNTSNGSMTPWSRCVGSRGPAERVTMSSTSSTIGCTRAR